MDYKDVLAGYSLRVATGIGGQGLVKVSTPGSQEQLAASAVCKVVSLTAVASNANTVAVGGSGVVAAIASRAGIAFLDPGEQATIDIDNPSLIYVDAVTANDGVSYAYLV